MTQPAERRCGFHSRRPSLSACASCGRGLCRDCIVATSVGFKCPSCTGGEQGSGPPPARLVAYSLLAAAAALAAAVGVAWAARSPPPVPEAQGVAAAGDPAVAHRTIVLRTARGEVAPGVLDEPHITKARAAAIVIPAARAAGPDGFLSGAGVTDAFYRDLAEAMTRRGLAVMRFGATEGTPFATRLRVVDTALQRAESISGKVVLVGHEAGALVAAAAASAGRVDALVLVAPDKAPDFYPQPSRLQLLDDVPVLVVDPSPGDAVSPGWRRHLAGTEMDLLPVYGVTSTLRRAGGAGGRVDRDVIALDRIAQWARAAAIRSAQPSGGGSDPAHGP